jgi:hypothetical protein
VNGRSPGCAFLAALASLLPLGAGAAPVPTLPPEALEAGQKAVVHTVFRGHVVETFDAEILGVLKGGAAAGDLILARATSERVVRTGVAQGMSGSPVYVDGKLVGALSSGWPFSREPVFGITPIGEMLEVLDHPASPPGGPSAGPGGVEARRGARPEFRGIGWEDPEGAPALSRGVSEAEGGAPVRLTLPLAFSGLHADAQAIARDWLLPLQFNLVPGGAAGKSLDPDSIGPGSAVAVDVLRGDLLLSAIGTVTWRDGDRILMFGHPFFQAGDVRMPLSTAEITTVVASDASSFKLGMRGVEAGVVEQDRRAAVSGRLGGTSRMLPVSVTLRGDPRSPRTFRFESIEDRVLGPALIGIAALSSMMESGGAAGNRTLRWRLGVHRPRAEALEIADVASGDQPPTEVALEMTASLALLFGNPYARLDLDSVSIAVEATPGRSSWILSGARADRAVVRPGETLRVRCELDRWRGGRETREIAVPIPEELAEGRYELRVAGGDALTRYEAQRYPSRFRPRSLEEAIRRLRESRPSSALFAVLIAPGVEVTRGGSDYRGLPASALSVLAPEVGDGARTPRAGAWVVEERLAFDGPVAGEIVFPIVVDERAPENGAEGRTP